MYLELYLYVLLYAIAGAEPSGFWPCVHAVRIEAPENRSFPVSRSRWLGQVYLSVEAVPTTQSLMLNGYSIILTWARCFQIQLGKTELDIHWVN